MSRALFTISILLLSLMAGHAATCCVAGDTIIGEWQGEDRKLTFTPDGAWEVEEEGYGYTHHYRFTGSLLYEIQRDGAIEYLDYYFVYFGDDHRTFGLVHYDSVYNRATGEIWDPEIMQFAESEAIAYFESYCELFRASADAEALWFEIYNRGECW